MAKERNNVEIPLNTRHTEFKVVQSYSEEYTANAVDGDAFIVQRDKKIHDAGVYSDGRIVQLKKTLCSTEVCKVSVDEFTGGNRFAVYRKNRGIPQSFKHNVEKAMSGCPAYSYSKYNCIEFVLELLEVYMKPTESDCMKIASGTKPKGFEVVKKFSDEYCKNARLGDLFLVQTGIFGWGFYHAGVCCHENGPEIIQFTTKGNGPLGVSAAGASLSSSCPGAVNKVHINTFSDRRKYAIYRRKLGIPDNFQGKVDEAMSRMPQYKVAKHNCVHFALELLCGELKTTERDVESLTEHFFD